MRRKERIEEMRRRGLGLRVKFIIFINVIVILVVVAVSFQLGQFMIDTQRQNLVDGLEDQTGVLLESLVSGAKDGLRTQNRLALGLLLRQKTAMQDATYVTISGEGSPIAEPYDYVWVTDDPDIPYADIYPSSIVLNQTICDRHNPPSGMNACVHVFGNHTITDINVWIIGIIHIY